MIVLVGAKVRQHDRSRRRYWDGFVRGKGASNGTVRIVWNDGIVDDVPFSDFETGFIRIVQYDSAGFEVPQS